MLKTVPTVSTAESKQIICKLLKCRATYYILEFYFQNVREQREFYSLCYLEARHINCPSENVIQKFSRQKLSNTSVVICTFCSQLVEISIAS